MEYLAQYSASEDSSLNCESSDTENSTEHDSCKETNGVKRLNLGLPNADSVLSYTPADDLDALKDAASQPLTWPRGQRQSQEKAAEWRLSDSLGRVRSFPPEAGSYPVTVMIPVILAREEESLVLKLFDELKELVPGLHPIGLPQLSKDSATASSYSSSGLSATSQLQSPIPAEGLLQGSRKRKAPVNPDPNPQVMDSSLLHVSLSRTVPVKFHLVPSLIQELQEGVKKEMMKQGFSMLLSRQIQCFVNDERTRSFVAMPYEREGKEGSACFKKVLRLIGAVNKAFIMHGLQVYYKDPKPHMSFGWAAGDQEEHLLRVINETLHPLGSSQVPATSTEPPLGGSDDDQGTAVSTDPPYGDGRDVQAALPVGAFNDAMGCGVTWPAGDKEGVCERRKSVDAVSSTDRASFECGMVNLAGPSQMDIAHSRNLQRRVPALSIPVRSVMCRVGLKDHTLWRVNAETGS
ncbi:hypothetical protein CEUSTIGMA_g3720.t1 [Chlamydomonas eustigma]|uniref:U6 snRNA phosphodiesterase 1 n=1 Tax=Chlamydomonas eustigma TaxID=1157962 RepID=A0A250WZR7_9CHLO|nr:hypothetical protein CEUSTIGMA_g3720.t1 [Chlamydomonas eustigma]|eukprot:GAX76276.1 hypothetical protein CEUSTIGMA_g3720.t1 [Chlamydomonas eustigma]